MLSMYDHLVDTRRQRVEKLHEKFLQNSEESVLCRKRNLPQQKTTLNVFITTITASSKSNLETLKFIKF